MRGDPLRVGDGRAGARLAVELPGVERAANRPAGHLAAVSQVRAQVRTEGVEDAGIPVVVAERDEISREEMQRPNVAHGELVAAASMDGAAPDTRLNAQRKAYTAARSDARSTRELAEKVRDDPAERASFDPFFTFFLGGVADKIGRCRIVHSPDILLWWLSSRLVRHPLPNTNRTIYHLTYHHAVSDSSQSGTRFERR